MKSKNPKEVLESRIEKYSSVLNWMWKITAGFSLFLFCFVTYNQRDSIVFNPSIQGFIEFERIFDFPIKVLTTSFILFGLWLTIERMKQTSMQIESISLNNNFNNFYRHREEFITYLEKESLLYIQGAKLTNDEKLNLYNKCFYSSYEKFEPIVNNYFLNLVHDFSQKIKSIIPSEKDFEFSEIKNILNNFNDNTYQLYQYIKPDKIEAAINSFVNDIIKKYNTKIAESKREEISTHLRNIRRLYFSCFFLQKLNRFGGIEEIFSQMEINKIKSMENLYVSTLQKITDTSIYN